MSFMLQATNQKNVYINGIYIQDIMMDEDDTILAVMQDGEVIPAIDIDPNQPFSSGLAIILVCMKRF